MESFEKLSEAEELLHEVRSWTEQEIEELPKLYQAQARELRKLLQPGEQ